MLTPATESHLVERLESLRVLVIDDLPDSAESMRELLEIEGAIAVAETEAGEAIERAHAEQFDVIICDIAMPGMDGHTMLREIRKSPLNANTPAIAHSGYGGPEDAARSKAAGFQMHLVKPTSLEQLIEAIEGARRST